MFKLIFKTFIRINTLCFISAPWIFGVLFTYLRLSGVINGTRDWVVGLSTFFVLLACCVVTVYLTYGRDDEL